MVASLGERTQTHPFRVNFIQFSHLYYAAILAGDSRNLLTLFQRFERNKVFNTKEILPECAALVSIKNWKI